MNIECGTDSSAAKAISERLGVGRVRHLEVASLWIQEATKRKQLRVVKLRGVANTADLGTKALDQHRLAELAKAVGVVDFDASGVVEVQQSRISSAPRCTVGAVSLERQRKELTDAIMAEMVRALAQMRL